ncbi:Uncharacterised protein [Bordetella pertussis]|nr:Uncharacterised protein [Bordetella pertussis]CFU79961.1 Uncharacterised protein [Bordetella pertussis]CPK83105.1 Uncharacterised protein [Bordetella pertussis]CPL59034.1 Uncharacterised protein [Bordetella pertussis]CPM60589.1 Uncharacterised protein [Bordetella pertussis]
MARTVAAVRERLLEQCLVTEAVIEAGFQRGKGHSGQWKRPMRLKSLKFIQTKNAFPTILPSGTNPQ